MEPIDDLTEKQRLLSGWVADYRERTEQLPYVQQSLDIVNYQIGVLSTAPAALPPSIRNEIVTAYTYSTPYWAQFAFASPTNVTRRPAISGSALEASGSNIAYQTLSAATVGLTPEVHEWARQKTNDYQTIQQRQDRCGQTRKILSGILPDRLAEFEAEETSFGAVLTNTQPLSTWGIHARNVLEHVKGDLFSAAQRAQKKQKIKWSEFADGLARGGIGSPEHTALIAEDATHRRLHLAFTEMAKNLVHLSEADLRDRRSEYHDHLFSLLSLVDESSCRKNTLPAGA